MTFFQWKRFNFFDIAKDTDGGVIPKVLEGCELTCTSSGRGHLILGDSGGRIHFFNRHLEPHTIPAFQKSVCDVLQLRQSGLLLALGQEAESPQAWLKVFQIDQTDKNGQPPVVRSSRVGSVNHGPATCLAAHENQNLLAVGFQDGTVVLCRGDVTRERGTKAKVVLDHRGPITSCQFKAAGSHILLYVVTSKGVFCVNVTVKDKESITVLDNVGCARHASIATDGLPDTQLITGRDDGVYCYTPEGRGQCYAFEGHKTFLHWFRNYLVVVSEEMPTSGLSSVSQRVMSGHQTRKHILTIFDVQNKFVAFTAPIKPLKAVISDWGLLFAMTEDYRLCQLTEKDIQTKLDMLFRKNFYDVAVKVAKSQQYDEEGLIDIFRQYGDHLYSKNDLTGAVENYAKTIGHLDPSYVIRKFLDTSKTIYLTEYLQALHSKNLANEDHTTLLLNCYTKLKDKMKLDEFILKDQANVDFDVDIAIRVCRQSGYHKHAIQLAKRHRRHEWYLRMQIEDLGEYKEALDYIGDLEFEQAEFNMKKYGNFLMKHIPADTTNLLKVLCSDYKPKNGPLVSEKMLGGSEDAILASPAEHFIPLFVQHSEKMVEFLEFVLQHQARLAGEGAYNTLLEHYLYQYSQAFRNQEFEKQKPYEAHILKILQNKAANYDEDKALILCQLHSCRAGLLFLYRRKELYGEILRTHMDAEELTQALQICREYGSEVTELWLEALKFVASDAHVDGKFVNEVLENIERLRLLSPLMVVKQLANSPNATLGMVRNFLLRVVKSEDTQLTQDKTIVEQYQKDSVKLQARLEDLQTKATVFQTTKCSACSHPLELPSVHFLCQHSYHQHCFQSFSETETDCPSCYPENKRIMDIVKSQEKSRDQHDLFHHQLNNADDSFSVIAEYFGRGVFRPSKLADVKSSLPEAIMSHASSPNLPVMSEARQRMTEGNRSSSAVSMDQPHEARLRAQGRTSGSMAEISEGQLRRNQSSQASRGIPQSDARLRQNEGSRATRAGESPRTRSNTSSPATRASVLGPKKTFGHAVEAEEDLGASNPFAEGKEAAASGTSRNPFGDPEYDESLNPFGS